MFVCKYDIETKCITEIVDLHWKIMHFLHVHCFVLCIIISLHIIKSLNTSYYQNIYDHKNAYIAELFLCIKVLFLFLFGIIVYKHYCHHANWFSFYVVHMMTSSNGNIFRATGHLYKGQWLGALIFFDLHLNKRLIKQSWGWWFETTSRSLWRHYNA